jgi:L-fuculose-phosphate aldolase
MAPPAGGANDSATTPTHRLAAARPMTSHDPDLNKRQSLIDACLRMNALGINQGTSGNISVRDADGMLITPTALPYDRMRPDDIVFVDRGGRAEGRRRPSSEWRFHRDILASMPDVHAVVHAHPPACTTLAILGRGIPAIHYMIAAAGGSDIRCAPYATFGTEALSAHALAALAGRRACLLAHHGMIAVAGSLERALWLAVEVEALARQYLGCLQLGGEPPLLSTQQIDEVIAKMADYGRTD